MTRDRFEGMTLREKARWIYFNGQLVTSIRYYQYKVNLYLLEKVYVEVFYHHTKDCVERIEPLDASSKRMNFYADQIRLPSGLV